MRSKFADVNQAAASLDTAGNFFYQLSQIPDISDITSAFARLKLCRVIMNWIPAFNTTQPSAGPLNGGIMMACFNPSNTAGTPTQTTVLSNNTHRMWPITRKFTYEVPTVVLQQLGDTITTYYAQHSSRDLWIDSASTAVKHFGFDWIVLNTGFAAATALGVWEITYDVIADLAL